MLYTVSDLGQLSASSSFGVFMHGFLEAYKYCYENISLSAENINKNGKKTSFYVSVFFFNKQQQ